MNTDSQFTCIKFTRVQIFHLYVHGFCVNIRINHIFNRDLYPIMIRQPEYILFFFYSNKVWYPELGRYRKNDIERDRSV